MDFETIKPLLREGQKSKIVLLVMDGLGGLPMEAGGRPNLKLRAPRIWMHWLPNPSWACITTARNDQAAARHLGLFGYDPIKFEIDAVCSLP